jgi:ATP-dependent DNA helicase DinG
LRLAAAGPLREVRAVVKRRWEDCDAALSIGLPVLVDAARELADALASVAETAPDFPRLEQRARALAALAGQFGEQAEPGRVRWVDLTPHQARLVESPLDIREMMQGQREAAPKPWATTMS